MAQWALNSNESFDFKTLRGVVHCLVVVTICINLIMLFGGRMKIKRMLKLLFHYWIEIFTTFKVVLIESFD